MTNHDYKYVLNMWLRNIKDVYRFTAGSWMRSPIRRRGADRYDRAECQGAGDASGQDIDHQRAWKEEGRPQLHGWVYGLKDGLIKPVFDMDAGSRLDPIYHIMMIFKK